MSLKDNMYRINVFIKDPNKKPVPLMIKEALDLWWTKGHFPLHYFGRFLYRKGIEHPKDYLDMREFRKIIYSGNMNQQEFYPILNNKLIFSVFAEKHQLPSPPVASYNFRNTFFHDGCQETLTNHKELTAYFMKVMAKSRTDRLFIKSVCGYGGREVFRIRRSHCGEDLTLPGNDIFKNSFVHQEGLDQHSALSAIYPHSINTLRVDTYIDSHGDIHILGAAMRFGSAGGVVDNISSGGFFVPVVPGTGRLQGMAMQGMIYGGRALTCHPDTHFVFKDFEVPFYHEALALCRRFTEKIPLRLAGWDVAITPGGPTIIEGNHTPYLLMSEVAYGGFVKHPLYKDIMANA